MPLRRRSASSDVHTFDLVDDTFDDDLDAPDDEVAPGPDPAARRRRRRVVLASVTAGALVLGGMVTVDAVAQRAADARLRAAPGGVTSIGGPPQVVWERELDFSATAFAVLPDALVVTEGDDVVGYDLADGEEAWRVPMEASAVCSPMGEWFSQAIAAPDRLVCVEGIGEPLEGMFLRSADVAVGAAVVAADGSVEARADVVPPADLGADLPDAGTVRWLPPVSGPDGAVLWAGRAGPVPAGQGDVLALDEGTGMPPVQGEPAAAVVAVQDVASGGLRWAAAVEATEPGGEGYECVQWTTSDDGDEMTVDLDQLWAATTDGVVHLNGCGVRASFTEDGVRADDPASSLDLAFPLGDGYLRDASGGSTLYGGSNGFFDSSGAPVLSAVLDAAGEVVWEADGLILPPRATDGRSDLWFVSSGTDLAAHSADGALLWEDGTTGSPDTVLVATAETVVVRAPMRIIGLDAETGVERWSLDRSDDPELASFEVGQAFTDGQTALFALSGAMDGGSSLMAVDLMDGTVRWTTESSTETWGYLSVAGRLVGFGEQGVVGLG
ncbi:outer membrane protein assembly factor BamB family protein [Cellulosimicrobium marinum]|uniref:outer membrane protein assembly factor BamB family protein n=1 Tax=Cellulosimicrobium marinum TaxID=1638992 RepID=UPI001E528BF1|nr:PQQ-binding-like beta-propeller repeat protein [Cellulosimicrobium marinum]MCB7136003.1 PQQ-like beta-propeller repeat protein [Cellulosimicrobium marinum]